MSSDTPSKKYSVLLIDDDKFLLDMYSMKFRECKDCSSDVEAVADPAKALEMLRAGKNPDLILLDVIMPGIDGFQFLEARKKEGLAKNAKVVMLTNQGEPADVQKAMDLGANGYIIKASAIPSEVLEKALSIASGKKA